MKRPLAALVALALWTPPALACYGEHLRSVHFNSAGPDFGTVPRRGPLWAHDYDDRPPGPEAFGMGYGGTVDAQELSGDNDALRAENRHRLLNEGDAAALSGDRARAVRLWRAVAARFGTDGGLRDRLEVAAHAPHPATGRYLAALRALEGDVAGWDAAGKILDALAGDASLPGWLREHALYQRGCLWRQWLVHERAIPLWQEQLRRFPDGEKREATLLMIARSALLGDAVPGARATGRAALDQLVRAFPMTRFRVAIRGLRARADLDDGRLDAAASAYCALADGDSIVRVRARNTDPHLERRLVTLQLIAYLRDFDAATSHTAYLRAGKGIVRTLALVKPDVGAAFLERLVRAPELAVPYVYFRLYHCQNRPSDLARLGALAERIAARHGADRLPGPVRVRLAEVAYRQRRWRAAGQWARTVLDSPDSRLRARALYVHAAALHKRGRITEARRDLEALLATCPGSPLRHGTRELLALCCEAQSDWERALELYTALGYDDDRAYLIDARMPIASLERYWRTHRVDRNLIAFSLGIRHLREERWSESRRWLRRVSPAAYAKYLSRKSSDGYWQAEFVRDPRKTLESLAFLHLKAQRARSRSARASALYAYAREYYTAGLLQLYNPPLWRFERIVLFEMFWNGSIETPADTASVRRYMYRHEVYAHTRRICLDIARQYPETPTAPYALYRAACAAEKLGSMNSWWHFDRDRYDRSRHGPKIDHDKEAIKLFQRVARRYPKHPLAHAAGKYAAVFSGKEWPE